MFGPALYVPWMWKLVSAQPLPKLSWLLDVSCKLSHISKLLSESQPVTEKIIPFKIKSLSFYILEPRECYIVLKPCKILQNPVRIQLRSCKNYPVQYKVLLRSHRNLQDNSTKDPVRNLPRSCLKSLQDPTMILFKILLGSNQDPVSNPVQNSTKFLHVQVPMLKIPQDPTGCYRT